MHTIFRPVELVNVQQIPLGKAQRISVAYIAESITVYEAEGDTLVLKEYLSDNSPDLFARVSADDAGITIKHGERPALLPFLRGYIELYLPKQYYGALNMQTISGKIEVKRPLTLSDLALSSTSGRVSLLDATAGTAVLHTVSGSIAVQSLQAMANLRSTSGSIRVEGAAGAGEYKPVSGAIEVNSVAVTGPLTLGSTSGRVKLMLPRDLSFSVEAHSVSGRIDIPFPGIRMAGGRSVSGTVGAPGGVKIKLNTVSGRIEALPLG